MQTLLKKLSYSLPSIILGVNVLAYAPVYAEDGQTTTDTQTTQTTENQTAPTTQTEHHGGRLASATQTEASDDGFRAQAQEQVAQLRKEKKTQLTDKQRTERCDAKKVGIQNEFNNIVNKEQKLHDRIADVNTKVTTFKTTKNLTVTNYDTLVAAVNTAEATSTASIAAAKADIPTIDCTKPDVATDIATFKAAATQARDDLKTYRTAVQNLLQAVKQAAAAANGTKGSSTSSTTETKDTTTSGGAE